MESIRKRGSVSGPPSQHRLMDEGGNWDHHNCLKVYCGLHWYIISIHQLFTHRSKLFNDALFMFTTTELMSYTDFVALTVICNMLALKRVNLKKVHISPDWFFILFFVC